MTLPEIPPTPEERRTQQPVDLFSGGERPVAPPPSDVKPDVEPARYWSDDDIASMSLGGCLSLIMLSFLWLAFYIRSQGLNSSVVIEMSEGRSSLPGGVLAGLLAASVIAFTGSVYLFGIRKHPMGWQAVKVRPVSAAWIWGSLVLGVLFVPVNILITTVMLQIMGLAGFDFDTTAQVRGTFPLVEFIVVFTLAALIVPLAEEIFFRGVIYQWLRLRSGMVMGILVSSVAFGALHFSIPSMASIAVLGAICTLVYEYSGSLWPAVIVHAANNAVVIVLSYVVFSTPLAI